MIRFSNVSFGYRPAQQVISQLDLEVPAGLTLLLGPNGCGKSTLLKLAAGVEQPDSGEVALFGHDLWRAEVAARRALAYVPELPDLSPYASVSELIALVCELRGAPPDAGREALERAGLAAAGRSSVRELSMGQRRRVVLAAAWIGAPRCAILDEPLEALDRRGRDDVLAWIDELIAQGAIVLVVSHAIEPFVAQTSRVIGLAPRRAPIVVAELPALAAARLACLEALARGQPWT